MRINEVLREVFSYGFSLRKIKKLHRSPGRIFSGNGFKAKTKLVMAYERLKNLMEEAGISSEFVYS
ncbi:hypothetical protein HS7_14800 [Sulfolobales archaeon HS-7]|nr:hypothetical protein HS7_14800 [Sulfolobales archaeon HS-7]